MAVAPPSRLAVGLLLLGLTAGPLSGGSAGRAFPSGLRVVATSSLGEARVAETVEVPASALARWLRPEELERLAVVEAGGGRPLLSQAVDADGDGVVDRIVFQADFAPGERRVFALRPGERRPYTRDDFRVYGRFVRERFDDFAWENDRVAYRMYGQALETWEKEPLTSSTVDVWCKRTRRLVIDDWYLVGDYHEDHGEGADLYSAGKSRGCGGSGLWADGRLLVSRNFRSSRVLSAGPIRLVFELTYPAWDVAGVAVSETKRITLDAGSNLSRFESTYGGGGAALPWAAGIKKVQGAAVRDERAAGWLRTWEKLKEGNGNLGCGIVAPPSSLANVTEAGGNVLVVSRSGAPAAYWAGSGWDRSGDFPSVEAWDRYLAAAARRLASPVRIEVSENPETVESRTEPR